MDEVRRENDHHQATGGPAGKDGSSSSKENLIHRRAVLSGIARLGVGSLLPGLLPGCTGPGGAVTSSKPSPRRPELIREENQRPGTRDWLLTKTSVDPATRYRSPAIEGYASRTSVRAGDTISFHVSTNPASRFTIDLYRMGYYGGAGARHMERLGSFPGSPQEDPAIGPERLRQCRWEPSTRLTVPIDWPSGIYLAKLTSEREGLQSYSIFIVRD